MEVEGEKGERMGTSIKGEQERLLGNEFHKST